MTKPRYELIAPRTRGFVRHDDDGTVHVIGRDDASPRYAGTYAAACGWCWLGASHSVDAHERKIDDAGE